MYSLYKNKSEYFDNKALLFLVAFSFLLIYLAPALISEENKNLLCISFQKDPTDRDQSTVAKTCFFCIQRDHLIAGGASSIAALTPPIKKHYYIDLLTSSTYTNKEYIPYLKTRAPPVSLT